MDLGFPSVSGPLHESRALSQVGLQSTSYTLAAKRAKIKKNRKVASAGHGARTNKQRPLQCLHDKAKLREFAYLKSGMDGVTPEMAANRRPESFYVKKKRNPKEINEKIA